MIPHKDVGVGDDNANGNGNGSDRGFHRKGSAIRLKPRKKLLPREEDPCSERVVTFLVYLVLLAYTVVIWLGEVLFLPDDETEWCESARLGYPNVKHYDNPDCNNNPCYRERPWQLLFVSQMECDFARRMIVSILFGAAIGFERKASDRPAGIRTMSLVSLGACFFTMCSQIAFFSSTMGWDAARVSAAVPSGVGFLGSALIWKGSSGTKGTPEERHEVHGLTTAASVWLSASIGVGVGGRLLVVSAYAVALVLLVLRLGPRLYFAADSSSFGDETESEWSSSEHAASSGAEESSDADSGSDRDGPSPLAGPKMNNDEQIRLLMGLSASNYYGESQRSLATMASVSNLRQFQSSPNLCELEEESAYSKPDLWGRRNSAPLEHMPDQYEIPLKDHNEFRPRRRKGRRRHRRRNRSHSPRRRKYQVGFLS